MIDIATITRTLWKKNSMVMVTLINNAYLPFTFSWLCNTRHMDVHRYVLFLTTDTDTQTLLLNQWPSVHSAVLHGLHSKTNETYSHTGYLRLMIKRSMAILTMLHQGAEIFVFEVDCVWRRDPIPWIQSVTQVDLLFTYVSVQDQEIAGGFIYLFPTNATKVLWGAVTRKMMRLDDYIRHLPSDVIISEDDNDQKYLSLLFHKLDNIRYKVLPNYLFPDGKWYNLTKEERDSLDPYLINNNWIIGNQEKINRAKAWKHWFLHENNTCKI